MGRLRSFVTVFVSGLLWIEPLAFAAGTLLPLPKTMDGRARFRRTAQLLSDARWFRLSSEA